MMSEYYDVDFGMHFDPTENQLIKDYLSPKINEGKEFDFIWNMDVYATEPWLLQHNRALFFKKYEWYYFATRTQVSESENNIGRGKKAKRKIIGDNGTWKANAKEKILDEETGKTIGIKQTLTFIKSNNNNKKQKREDGTSSTAPGSDSSWTMTEYMLVEEDKFQGTVLCKIHEIKKSKKNEDDHQKASASTYYHNQWASSSSGKQPVNNDRESFLASSLEQQPLTCSVNVPETPHTGSQSSLNCSVAGTSRNREHSEERNITHQVDAYERVPERSSDNDETKEVAQGAEEDWIEDYMNKYTTKGLEAFSNNVTDQHEAPISAPSQVNVSPAPLGDWLEDYPIDAVSVDVKDQQQAPISAPSGVNVSSAPLGDRSRPMQLDEEEEEWTEELVSELTREEEDAPSLQWMDQ